MNPLAHGLFFTHGPCFSRTPIRQCRYAQPSPFSPCFPVRDLSETRAFYGQLLGCREGRSSDEWVDFDFFGHQIVAHLSPSEGGAEGSNCVDGEDVPVRHFGVILEMPEWRDLAGRLAGAGVKFLIEPGVRFEGQPGEQATLFVRDPSGNALEFK